MDTFGIKLIEYRARQGYKEVTNRLLDHHAFFPCNDVSAWMSTVVVREHRLVPEGRNRRRYTTAVWKMLTNHELVVAWQLLEAVCPVLLTRVAFPEKTLQHSGCQQFVSLYRGKLPFLFVIGL